MKLCVNCKWCIIDRDNREHSTCSHPKFISPVTGEPFLYCEIERRGESHLIYPCGRDGALWEPRESEQIMDITGQVVAVAKLTPVSSTN